MKKEIRKINLKLYTYMGKEYRATSYDEVRRMLNLKDTPKTREHLKRKK